MILGNPLSFDDLVFCAFSYSFFVVIISVLFVLGAWELYAVRCPHCGEKSVRHDDYKLGGYLVCRVCRNCRKIIQA